jgi:pilus assembly protein CpaC
MSRLRIVGKWEFGLIIAVVTLLISYGGCLAADSIFTVTRQPRILKLVLGKSIVLRSSQPVKRISEPTPEIAEAIPLSPYEIYINGKASGTTTLILWQKEGIAAIYDIEVAYDISRLKQKLNEIFPEEKDIRVLATQDSIALAGRLSSAANISQAMALAESYAPEGKVRNLLEVGGVHQVMLEVQVAEMARTTMKKLGINFSYAKGGDFAVNSLGNLIGLDPITGIGGVISPAVNALFRFNSGGATWTGLISALNDEGLLKILAEPSLMTLSGQTAHFLAGGEFPVPVPQGLGTVAIEYKEFGVGLSFTPTVLSQNKISIQVAPDISELDFTTSVRIQGFSVPGLRTRRASTMVELADGQSFAIAGLLQENIRDNLSKYPGLGNLPILGTLFRSREFEKKETELIIIVTVHLVKPIDIKDQPMPTDYYIEPSNADIYLWGKMQGSEKNKQATIRGEMDGEFGHVVPKIFGE